jgi:poly-beta-1,6-N-acetyl-D-glucosamine synthase
VRGCTKIYHRQCFEDIGGLAPSMGWDGLDEWTALSLGWKVHSFVEHRMYHFRFTGSATGRVKSYQEQGYAAYRIGYHPLYLVARSIRCIPYRPFFIGGMAMIAAYFLAWARRDQIIARPLVIRFIRAAQLLKLAHLLAGKAVHET